MLLITIELWKYGDLNKRKIIGTAMITNDGTGTESHGNYTARICGKMGSKFKQVEIDNFPRKSYTAWKLLYLALKELFENR